MTIFEGFLSLTLSRPCLISGPAEAVAKAGCGFTSELCLAEE